jgi:hypothetical protein
MITQQMQQQRRVQAVDEIAKISVTEGRGKVFSSPPKTITVEISGPNENNVKKLKNNLSHVFTKTPT